MVALEYAEVNKILDYDPETGIFKRLVKTCNSAKVGELNPCVGSGGYQIITIFNKRFLAHRLAWLLFYKEMPKGHIDHIDGNGLNNKIENLRLATQSENMQNKKTPSNNKSGYKGVSFCNMTKKWVARIRIPSGKYANLGRYENPLEAHLFYISNAIRYYGQFARMQ